MVGDGVVALRSGDNSLSFGWLDAKPRADMDESTSNGRGRLGVPGSARAAEFPGNSEAFCFLLTLTFVGLDKTPWALTEWQINTASSPGTLNSTLGPSNFWGSPLWLNLPPSNCHW
jgi:hypothetical protein